LSVCFFDCRPCHPGFPAFPTRRSSDLLASALATQDGRFYTGAAAEFGFSGQLEGIIVPPAGIWAADAWGFVWVTPKENPVGGTRSEEHTSELQSRENLVCRLLLEKKKK